MGENICKDISYRRLFFKIYKVYLKLNNKEIKKTGIKTNKQTTKQAKDHDRQLAKGDIQIENEHMKRCSTSYVIRRMQIKATIKCCYIPVRMAKIQNTDYTKY